VIIQLADYRSGKRSNAVMGALARTLSERDSADLAAYFASLPRPAQAGGLAERCSTPGAGRRSPAQYRALHFCHGGADRKIGAPWLDGLPRHYLAEQLALFKRGERANDAMLQMRNVAHAMREDEISAIADYCARGSPAILPPQAPTTAAFREGMRPYCFVSLDRFVARPD
jgi:cytochrome c553